MGPDRKKQFLKKNSSLVPSGEDLLAVIVAEGKGRAWRRGLSSWPDSSLFWVALTDKQLHVFEGQLNSQNAGPAAAHYPFERIADMRFEKKLLISKLAVSFTDGSSVDLDIAKQNIKPFVEAIESRFAPV